MVGFNPAYLARHPEVTTGAKLEGCTLKDYTANVFAAPTCPGISVTITHWRKLWKTRDKKLRDALNDQFVVQLWINGHPRAQAPLRGVPTDKWGPIPTGVWVCQLPCKIAVGLASIVESPIDPGPHVDIELGCAPTKGCAP